MNNFFWSHTSVQQFANIKYGYLYNWYAATDARNITADGWVVPIFDRWWELQSYLGGEAISGGKLKEIGLTYWRTPNTGATNEVGFNGRGSGIRGTGGVFAAITEYSFYWTPSPFDIDLGWRAGALGYIYSAFPVNSASNKYNGFSIRLLKSSTTLSHGQTGTYTGNDGKLYRTICINGVEYLSENLAETKYRNGDPIPEVTDNATWAGLTTGARCVYGNDENNR